MQFRPLDSRRLGVEGIRLGFGCASLGSTTDLRIQCEVVEAAYEAGFRHFDLAPSYAHGDAEIAVGTVLGSVRETISIATKVGIAHPRRPAALREVRRWLAPLKPLLPALWGVAARKTSRMIAPAGRFEATQVEASLYESLRRLRCGSVDSVLLHEARPEDVGPALLDCLERLRERRLVETIGTGTTVADTMRLAACHPGRFDVVQMDHYWGSRTQIPGAERATVITHRAIRNGFDLVNDARFRAALAASPRHSELKNVLNDRQSAPDLFLLAALRYRKHGMVLASTSQPRRAARLIDAAVRDEMFSLADALNDCLDRVASGPNGACSARPT